MKILKKFLLVLFFLNVSLTLANRDCVSSVTYGETTHNPLNVTLSFDNVWTPNNPDYIVTGNLFPLASFTVVAGGCTVTKNSDYITVRYTQSNSGVPASTHTCKIKIEVDKEDLQDYANGHLNISDSNEKKAIVNSIDYGLVDTISVTLKLMTTSNGTNTSDYTAHFPSYVLVYKFAYDESLSQCKDGQDNDNDGKIDFGVSGFGSGSSIEADPDCSICGKETCPSIVTYPNCNDGVDNDGDGKKDLNDPDCSSYDDVTENTVAITNNHVVPSIGLINLYSAYQDYVSINNNKIGNQLGTITMLADTPLYNGKIPLGYFNITNLNSSAGIKSVVATVMNSNGTAPLSSNCIYSGSYDSSNLATSTIPIYITDSCLSVRHAGDYVISYQYVDAEGYLSPEYYINLRVIPGNLDISQSSIQFYKLTDPVYADAYSAYKYILLAKDKYNNTITGRNLINQVVSTTSYLSDEILDNYAPFVVKENSSIDANGYNTGLIYAYNSFSGPLGLKFNFYKYTVNGVDSSSMLNGDITGNSVDFSSLFSGFKMELSGGQINQAFNEDVLLDLKTLVKNYNNSNQLSNVKFKFKPFVKNKDTGEDVTDKIDIVATTGYENELNELKNGNYNYGILGKNNIGNIKLGLRIEPKTGLMPGDYVLGGTGWIQYDLDGVDGIKTIRKKINWESNIHLKPWTVYIGGLSINKVKGLYEMFRGDVRNTNGTVTSSNNTNLKISMYNKIVQNTKKLALAQQEYDQNILGDVDGIYYKQGDLTLNGGIIKKKSLVYVEGGNVIIKGNYKKVSPDALLTIVVVSKDNEGGYIFIDNTVTNIDAVLVAEKGIYPSLLNKDGQLNKLESVKVVKGLKNSELNNQLLIYGMVVSRGNTVGGSIKINDSYVLPGGKKTDAFYKAAMSDLIYLRRYHKDFNRGEDACDPRKSNDYDINCVKLDENKYGTYPVVIFTDPAIQQYKPYGF